MGHGKSILVGPDHLVEGATLTLSQLSPHAGNLISNNCVLLIRCCASSFCVSSPGRAKMTFRWKQESTRAHDSYSISISRRVPAIFRCISLCSMANSEARDKKIHAKSYTLRNVAICLSPPPREGELVVYGKVRWKWRMPNRQHPLSISSSIVRRSILRRSNGPTPAQMAHGHRQGRLGPDAARQPVETVGEKFKLLLHNSEPKNKAPLVLSSIWWGSLRVTTWQEANCFREETSHLLDGNVWNIHGNQLHPREKNRTLEYFCCDVHYSDGFVGFLSHIVIGFSHHLPITVYTNVVSSQNKHFLDPSCLSVSLLLNQPRNDQSPVFVVRAIARDPTRPRLRLWHGALTDPSEIQSSSFIVPSPGVNHSQDLFA
jgi:hypothetical protein